MQQLGKYIIIIGFIVIAGGLIIYFAGDKFNWFGNLPGDIKVKKQNFSFYAPITSMILLSILISFIFWLIGKFMK